MSLELRVTVRAVREIERINQWWAANRPAAQGAVQAELERSLAVLVEQPGVGLPVPEASSPGVRRFLVSRIRYWIYFRVRGHRLEILSLWHASRGNAPRI